MELSPAPVSHTHALFTEALFLSSLSLNSMCVKEAGAGGALPKGPEYIV